MEVLRKLWLLPLGRVKLSPYPAQHHSSSRRKRESTRPTSRRAQQQFELMQRTSTFFVGLRNLKEEQEKNKSCDFIFEEVDVIERQRRLGARGTRGVPSQETLDLTALEAQALVQYMCISGDSVFLEMGKTCRGRLPLNLALNYKCKECISLSPDLQQTVDASQLCSPVIQSELPKCPVKFVCAEPHHWNYKGVTHVFLHNKDNQGFQPDVCRAVVAKLAASAKFSLLITTAPLPFQHHLIFIGDAMLHQGISREDPSKVGLSSRQGSLLDSRPASRTVYFYATSLDTVPVGTMASLFCKDGVCVLPGSVQHATANGGSTAALSPMAEKWANNSESKTADGNKRSLSSSKGIFELPPLALHTNAYQDM